MSPPPPDPVRSGPLLIAVVGPSGSGKTTLVTRLLPALEARGLRAGAIKHSRHPHPLQPADTDTGAMLAAGARAVAFVTPAGVLTARPQPAPSAAEVAALLPDCDVILVEGWRSAGLPALRVARAGHRDPTWHPPSDVVAWVGDRAPPAGTTALPFEAEAVAAYLKAFWGRGQSAGG